MASSGGVGSVNGADTLRAWRDRWTAAGFPTIPLRQDTKRPFQDDWQTVATADLWREVGPEFAGNIGVRMGNGNVVIDADAPKTRETVEKMFAGLGIDLDRLPMVGTATPGHYQYPIRVSGVPTEGAYRNLPADVTGPGELRYGPGAQCAAPCSVVGGRAYEFERGAPEWIPGLREIGWDDLVAGLALDVAKRSTKRATVGEMTRGLVGTGRRTPVPLLRRDMPGATAKLLEDLKTALPRQMMFSTNAAGNLVTYDSRSESECAVVASLILAGWDLGAIEKTFYIWQPGHWREQRNRNRCLEREYDMALASIVSNPNRRAIANLYQEAQFWAWPGRGGASERNVYLGLLAVGWQWASWQPAASVRCLSEYAGTSRKTVSKALKRLLTGGLVEVMTPSGRAGSVATCWDLSKGAIEGFVSKIPHKTHKRGKIAAGAVAGEVWRQVGRGEKRDGVTRSPELVWTHLADDPAGVAELAELTGKSRRTVYRALDRLMAWDLAERVDGGWVRSARTLADVADEVDAAGRATARHRQHERERDAWRSRNPPGENR